jgi:transcriptional regulator with XRE-family HTH domain
VQRSAALKYPIPADFPERIRRLRVKYGLTQIRLAELMGVSFASVNRWENGQSRPSPLAWQQIIRAERLGVAIFEEDYKENHEAAEPAKEYEARVDTLPTIDFLGDPVAVWAISEAERLTYGYICNPAFATEVSLIDPLPHQRLAVYENMLNQTRLRYLLADDAGAGKTIMAGLYIREMLARRLLKRVLIIPPAGLVGNWQRELRTLFNLSFCIAAGSEARAANPFIGPDSNLLIISLDTLAGERMFSRLQDLDVLPYDLVIFDEAHKLSASQDPDLTVRKTDRYRLAEALVGLRSKDLRWDLNWSCHHLLLLTATPHMGKDFPYFSLWRLLEPKVLSTMDAFKAYPDGARRHHFIRRTKEEMVRMMEGLYILPGSPIR